jgi:hypothetical protein
MVIEAIMPNKNVQGKMINYINVIQVFGRHFGICRQVGTPLALKNIVHL